MKTTTNAARLFRCPCAKCHGTGRLNWTALANGVCFDCAGTGVLVVSEELVAAALPARADAIARVAKAIDALKSADDETWTERVLLACLPIALAPADVQDRALAAVARIASSRGYNEATELSYITRQGADERARYLSGWRTRSVRAA